MEKGPNCRPEVLESSPGAPLYSREALDSHVIPGSFSLLIK